MFLILIGGIKGEKREKEAKKKLAHREQCLLYIVFFLSLSLFSYLFLLSSCRLSFDLPLSFDCRTCPARNYSLDVMALLTAMILQAYHIEYVTPEGASPEGPPIIENELVHHSMSLTMPKDYGLKFKKIANVKG